MVILSYNLYSFPHHLYGIFDYDELVWIMVLPNVSFWVYHWIFIVCIYNFNQDCYSLKNLLPFAIMDVWTNVQNGYYKKSTFIFHLWMFLYVMCVWYVSWTTNHLKLHLLMCHDLHILCLFWLYLNINPI